MPARLDSSPSVQGWAGRSCSMARTRPIVGSRKPDSQPAWPAAGSSRCRRTTSTKMSSLSRRRIASPPARWRPVSASVSWIKGAERIALSGGRPLHVEERRQGREHGIERPHVAAEIAADEPGAARPAAAFLDHQGQPARRHITQEGEGRLGVVLRRLSGLAQHRIGVAVREHQDVAGLERRGRTVRDTGPAGALEDDVVGYEVLGAGQDIAGESICRRNLDAPRPGGVDDEEQRSR